MKSENEQTPKQEPAEQQPSQAEDFPLGEAYCGTDGPCESCQ